ncbi:MAG TPA: alpha-glucan family phosphorylase [Elusimicrobiota bacterium]|nr:alpha-glucan family phosphorylase [Elusimicrobiota bacterium]
MQTNPFPCSLPEELRGLDELWIDLRWIWNHSADRLWQAIDEDMWQRTENPWLVLQSVSQQRLEELGKNKEFCGQLAEILETRREYYEEKTWFKSAFPDSTDLRVAYFSMEYGIGEALPLYSGGLGILAGDHLKAASDLGVPLTAVGILYQEGYFRQMIDAEGRQMEFYPNNNAADLPIAPVRDAAGAWLRIPVQLPGRVISLRVWKAKVGRVDLYLLDSNDPMNSPADRGVLAKLYPEDRQTRLIQEILLGIGGWRTLEALGIKAGVCHINEGHAAFAVLERARGFMKRNNSSFGEALWITRAGNIFTTHTPVKAGFDVYSENLLAKYMRDYVEELGISLGEFLDLGRHEAKAAADFNMAYFAMRTCARVNAVSRAHGEVSRRIFQDLYPRWPAGEVPVSHVTNGVHVPSWDSPLADRIWTDACGKERWMGRHEPLRAAIEKIGDTSFWAFAGEKRRILVAYARERLAKQLNQRGGDAAAVFRAESILDPNVLTLGFARRFTDYKRPDLLLRDEARLVRLLTNQRMPVQIIVAGKSHPQDEPGKDSVRAWMEFVRRPDVRAHAVFLEDYDIALAQKLVQGVDVWINTPRHPWEACGTSGMKVLVNGGVNLSGLEGWWAEAYSPDVGWALGAGPRRDGRGDDAADAEELYEILEKKVVPQFYERDSAGIPRRWVGLMRCVMARLAPQFSSSRMLLEYVKELYLPAAADFGERTAGGKDTGKNLLDWEIMLRRRWGGVHIGGVDAKADGAQWALSVPVYFGDLDPSAVRVEICADAGPETAMMRQEMERGERIAGAANGYIYRTRMPASRPAGDFTPRVVPFFPGVRVPAELPLILWQK